MITQLNLQVTQVFYKKEKWKKILFLKVLTTTSNKTRPEFVWTADSFSHFVNFIFDDSKLTRFQSCADVGMDIWIDIWIDSNKNFHWIFWIWKFFERLDKTDQVQSGRSWVKVDGQFNGENFGP